MINVFNVLTHDTHRDFIVNDYAKNRHYMVELNDDATPISEGYPLPPPPTAILVAQFDTLHEYLKTIKPTTQLRKALYVAMWPKMASYIWTRPSTHDLRPQIAARYGTLARHLRHVTSQYVRDIRNEASSGSSSTYDAALQLVEQCSAAQNDVDSTLVTRCVAAFNSAVTDAGWEEYTVIRARHCGHWCVSEDIHSHDDGSYGVCQSCYDAHYVTCVESDEQRHEESLYYWESDDGYHEEPEQCSDDDEGECSDLLSYSSRAFMDLTQDTPSVQEIASTWKIPLGVELEIEHESRNSAVVHTMDTLGRDYIVCKQDGSLDDDNGFEIVTAARFLPEHIKRFKEWKPMRGMTAWDTGRCGMHVHVDSRAFTTASLARMITFFDMDHNAAWLTNIAGRHPNTNSQAKTYAGKTALGTVGATYARKKSEGGQRYRMVNTCSLSRVEAARLNARNGGVYNTRGFSTVEVRLFRASLKKARLLAQIEFTHAIVTFSRMTSNRALTHEDFTKWLLGCPDNRNLYQHLVLFLGHDRKPANVKAIKANAETVS
jgi:hypothetical protein